jgi:hypothetical protein
MMRLQHEAEEAISDKSPDRGRAYSLAKMSCDSPPFATRFGLIILPSIK